MSDLPSPLRQEVTRHLGLRKHEGAISFVQVGGGCINQGGKITTAKGTYFVKWNDASRLPGMFAAEARGLSALLNARVISVPEVVTHGERDGIQWLMLEWIASAARNVHYWDDLGRRLASLHKVTHPRHGFDHDNYIGSLPQHNSWSDSWIDFFVEKRLQPQLRVATDLGKADRTLRRALEALCVKLPSLLPEEAPALLHGDLWSGNLMTTNLGEPCLIDPAVYFGHREMDLAMTRLFGGFDSRFYDAYHEAYPLQPGFDHRIDIYNLYPLLVHVNLFGGGYTSQMMQILRQLG